MVNNSLGGCFGEFFVGEGGLFLFHNWCQLKKTATGDFLKKENAYLVILGMR